MVLGKYCPMGRLRHFSIEARQSEYEGVSVAIMLVQYATCKRSCVVRNMRNSRERVPMSRPQGGQTSLLNYKTIAVKGKPITRLFEKNELFWLKEPIERVTA